MKKKNRIGGCSFKRMFPNGGFVLYAFKYPRSPLKFYPCINPMFDFILSFSLYSATGRLLCTQCRLLPLQQQQAAWNSTRVAVARINRKQWPKLYSSVYVRTDGSSVRILHAEPRPMILVGMQSNCRDRVVPFHSNHRVRSVLAYT